MLGTSGFEKFLPGEVKEIAMAALVTLEETRKELEGSLKTNIQVHMSFKWHTTVFQRGFPSSLELERMLTCGDYFSI